jgi:hypothetical protein
VAAGNQYDLVITIGPLIMMKFIRWTDLAIHCPGRRPPRAFRLGTGISERLSLAGRGAL